MRVEVALPKVKNKLLYKVINLVQHIDSNLKRISIQFKRLLGFCF